MGEQVVEEIANYIRNGEYSSETVYTTTHWMTAENYHSILSDAELEYARKAISSLGCDVVKTVPFILPDEEQSERFVAVMRKLRFTPKMYPRHGGTITKKPLFLEQKGEAK